MRDDYDYFEQAGLEVVAIGMGSPSRTREFRSSLMLPYSLLCDPRRVAYEAYGLIKMSLLREARPNSVVRLMDAVRRHGGAREPEQPMRQLGGVFVVDTTGIVRYAFRSHRASEHPDNEELLRHGAQPASSVVKA